MARGTPLRVPSYKTCQVQSSPPRREGDLLGIGFLIAPVAATGTRVPSSGCRRRPGDRTRALWTSNAGAKTAVPNALFVAISHPTRYCIHRSVVRQEHLGHRSSPAFRKSDAPQQRIADNKTPRLAHRSCRPFPGHFLVVSSQ